MSDKCWTRQRKDGSPYVTCEGNQGGGGGSRGQRSSTSKPADSFFDHPTSVKAAREGQERKRREQANQKAKEQSEQRQREKKLSELRKKHGLPDKPWDPKDNMFNHPTSIVNKELAEREKQQSPSTPPKSEDNEDKLTPPEDNATSNEDSSDADKQPQPLSSSQLEELEKHAKAGDAIKYYETLSKFGRGYGDTALGVIGEDSLISGPIKNYVETHAKANGLDWTDADYKDLTQKLMEADLEARSKGFTTTDEIHKYHVDAFREKGLPPEAWPGYILDTAPVGQNVWCLDCNEDEFGESVNKDYDFLEEQKPIIEKAIDPYIGLPYQPPAKPKLRIPPGDVELHKRKNKRIIEYPYIIYGW